MSIYTTPPKSKAQVIDRLLSSAFTGDLRDLSPDGRITLNRVKPHIIKIRFLSDNSTFLLAVHKPKPEAARKRAAENWRRRHAKGRKSEDGNQSSPPNAASPPSPLGRYEELH